MTKDHSRLSRRKFFIATASALSAPSLVMAQTDRLGGVRRNVSSFAVHNWQDHFDSIGKGIIISDTNSKVLQHWTADGEMRLYPTSVPLSEELTKRGYTTVVGKRKNPTWRPTPSMLERNPDWPRVVQGGDPINPLGTRALYLSWTYYRIHGTQDTRKIGRKSSNGCIGLYNEQIEEVYERTPVGTQVKLI